MNTRFWSVLWKREIDFYSKNYLVKVRNFCKYYSKLKVKQKTNPWFFLKFLFALFTPKVWIIHKNVITFYFFIFFENEYFTLSSFIFNNYLQYCNCHEYTTTLNNQFEALNAPKNRISLVLSHFLCTKTTSISLSLYIHQKKPRFWF